LSLFYFSFRYTKKLTKGIIVKNQKIKIYFDAIVENKNGIIQHKIVSSLCPVEKINEDGTILLKVDSMDTLSDYAIYDPKDQSVILI